jgi:hypothetical protein
MRGSASRHANTSLARWWEMLRIDSATLRVVPVGGPWREFSTRCHSELMREPLLPVCVVCPVESRALRLGVHVENVLASPGRGVGVVLDCLEIPIGVAGHGIHGNAPQEADFAVSAGSDLHARHQRFQVRRITFASYFHADEVAVRVILIVVDGITHFAQGPMELRFSGPDDGEANDRQRCRCEYKKKGGSDNQLEKSHTVLRAAGPGATR